ncbi:MAG: hypothetical protein SFW67_07260 [Myxococcaceae bacterium]|nr:hypothetical protein [Myxococcaceae bacterium]
MRDELIAPDVHRLIQLFSALPEVKFPDVDAPMLQELVVRVKERHLAVAQAEAQLEAARRVLDEDQEALLKKAHRLAAWLSVLAQTDEVLAQKLAVISLPKLKRPTPVRSEGGTAPDADVAAPKKRGRPRKVTPASEALFSEAAAASP